MEKTKNLVQKNTVTQRIKENPMHVPYPIEDQGRIENLIKKKISKVKSQGNRA